MGDGKYKRGIGMIEGEIKSSEAEREEVRDMGRRYRRSEKIL